MIQYRVYAKHDNTQLVTNNCMNNSNSSSNPTSPRTTLKLKIGARKLLSEGKAVAALQPQATTKSKPGAHWSDEYKKRMQADMDALASR